ncbi:MAG: carbohydrate binding domain-containing protein [Patescibacteria group bacterium]
MSNGVKMVRRMSAAALSVLALLGGIWALTGVLVTPVAAVAGINEQINFQGRLFNAQGAVVPDGYYNVEFKIYQDGDGQAVGNPSGTLAWTESFMNNNSQGVLVKNGYMSVELGSVNPFGNQVDWNQSVLWLSMNIGNTNPSCASFAACSPDGEMTPMKRLSSTPYSMNAGKLGGLTSAGFIQNTTTPQTADFSITGAGTAATLTGTTSVLSPTVDTASASALSIGTSTATSVTIGQSTTATTLASANLTLGTANVATILQAAAQTTTNTAGAGLTIRGATGNGSGAGGTVAIQGGDAGATNANGGNLLLSGGAGTGTGVGGLVVITTPTFQTAATDANCYTGGALVTTSCTITAASVNNNAAIVVGFSVDGQTATLPNPGVSTAGRVIYLTAANGSKDFTISVNSGGVGNIIAMRQNTSATMIWNGTDWTAAGASSSTTLQSAYDNTLQSAGGAELVVSKTSSTNGLTIRDSSTAPVNGTLLSVQSSSAASLLSINSNVTEYAANGGAESAGGTSSTFPANTWSGLGGATVARHANAGDYIATGQGSVSIATGAVANAGVKNQFSSALNANTTYNVSFTARLASGTFTDMNVYYSADGTAATTVCTAAASARTSIWSKINCTFTTPTSGISAANAILIRQTGGTARTLYVDNLAVNIAANYNFATDPSVSNVAGFSTNWTYTTGTGTGTVTRNTAEGNDASDSATATVTSGAANAGVRNKLSSTPLPGTLYRATVYAKATTAFSDFKVRYSRDGGTSFVDCVDYNTQVVSTTEWTKISCYVKTDATAASNPYVYFVETAAAARTFSVDTFSMTLATSSSPNVQIGGGVNGGPTTLLTLDKGASAPVAGDNEALLGSMYYDTTLGKLQCFEADGWGACGSSPDTVVTISPEYTNAVLHGTGIGTMVSDLCSDTLNINDGSSSQPTICGTNETYNFYKWTSPQATAQSYSIYVTYQLPGNFSSFASGKTSIMGRTDSTNATVNYQVYRNDPTTGLTACGSPVVVSTGIVSTWQTGTASGSADPSTCAFTPNSSIVFKINATASQNASGYVGNLNFTFNNR